MAHCAVLLLWAFFPILSSGIRCHFEFPTVTNAMVTAKESANITLPFTLRDVGCIGSSEYSIVVGQAAGTGIQTPDVICQIHVIDSVCRSYTGLGCSCLQGRGRFQLDKTVNRSDNGTLLLFYFGGFQEQVVRGLIFNILYPARVSSLVLGFEESQESDRNQPVEVTCSWENGNPRVTARLLDRHGVEMEGSNYGSGQIRYRLPAVGCQDSGLIHCEAPGASQNKSVFLPLKCVPEFQNFSGAVSVMCGETIHAKFPVTSHTTRINDCQLERLTSHASDSNANTDESFWIRAASLGVQCIGFVKLTGTPPDLTLTVRLDNVRKEEEGQWRLELTNDAGTGYLDFYIYVKEKDTEESNVPVVAGASVAAVAAILTVSVTVFICVRRGFKATYHSLRRAAFYAVHVQRQDDGEVPHRVSNRQSTHTYNYYWEIPDEPDLVPTDNDAPSPQPCRQATRTCPDDYLIPDDAAKVEENDSTVNTIPLYENSMLRTLLRPLVLPAVQRRTSNLPDDYLTPSVSHDVTEGTDGARNVIPLYENGRAGPLPMAGISGHRRRANSLPEDYLTPSALQEEVETIHSPKRPPVLFFENGQRTFCGSTPEQVAAPGICSSLSDQ